MKNKKVRSGSFSPITMLTILLTFLLFIFYVL